MIYNPEVGELIPTRKITKRISGIYKIVNAVDSRYYIGQSTNIIGRWEKHITNLNNGNHIRNRMQSDWNRLGPPAFFFTIVYLVDDEESLLVRERRVIYREWRKGADLYLSARTIKRLGRVRTSDIEREMWFFPHTHKWRDAE